MIRNPLLKWLKGNSEAPAPVTIEFTTQIGCPIQCLEYCPQEVITKNYRGDRSLSLDKFKFYLSTVPKNVIVIIAGASEPFLNQECADMILHAHETGHEILLYTTLVGLKPEDAERIKNVPFKEVFLHLPDGKGISKIPYTSDYIESRKIIETNVWNISFMNMGGKFKTVHCENMIRGTSTLKNKGRVFCNVLYGPQYFVLPNGDVSFCCMTRGQQNVIGNLNTNTYPELAEKHRQYSYYLQNDQGSMCHYCDMAYPYWFYLLVKLKSKFI